MAQQCPKCKGTKIKDNKLNTRGGAPGYFYNHGHPVVAGVIVAIKAAGMLHNLLRHRWTCESCSHEFS
jgi:hypothetical protein